MSELRLKATPMCKNLIVINGSASRHFAPVLAGRCALRIVTAPRRGNSIVQLFFFRCAIRVRFRDLNDQPIHVLLFVRSVDEHHFSWTCLMDRG